MAPPRAPPPAPHAEGPHRGNTLPIIRCALILLIAACPFAGQAAPPLDEEPARLAIQRAETRVAASPSERRMLAEAVIDRRRRLLKASPDAPQRAEWLLDQAEDLLLLLLPSDGSDLLALFGRPPDDERRRAVDLMREALACLKESAAERAQRHRAAPAEAEAIAARREALLRGMVLSMLAECEGGDQAAQRREEAMSALAPLMLDSSAASRGSGQGTGTAAAAGASLGPLDATARRLAQTHLALALAGLQRTEEAVALLDLLIEEPDAAPLDRLRAQLAAAVIIGRHGGNGGAGAGSPAAASRGDRREASRRLTALTSASTPDGDGDLFRRLLATDAQVNLLLLDSGPSSAWLPYRTLLANATGAERRALRSLVLGRIAQLAAQLAAQPATQLAAQLAPQLAPQLATPAPADPPRPALEVLALLLQAGEERLAEETARSLRNLLEREDLPSMERALAGLALGEAMVASGDPRQAAELLLATAEATRGETEALECAARAAELAALSWRSAPEDAASRTRARVIFERVLVDFPDLPELDRWLLEAASLGVADARTADALALLARIASDSPQRSRADVVVAEALVAEARALDAVVQGAADEPSIAAQGRATGVVEHGEQAARWRQALRAVESLPDDGPDEAVAHRRALLRAEALLALEQPWPALQALAGVPIHDDEAGLHLWRLTLLALEGAGRLEEAPMRARTIAEAGAAAVALRVLVARLDELERTCMALEDEGRLPEAQAIGRQSMLPLAQAADAALASGPSAPPELRGAAARLAARGSLRGGRPADALRLIGPLLESQPDVIDDLATKAQALFELAKESRPSTAEAPNGSGDDGSLAEAMVLLKRISAARRERRDRFFWMAETLQLEILRHLDRGTIQIAPRVEQLRRLDAQLGGPGWRRRLEAVAMDAAPKAPAVPDPPQGTN